MIATSQAQAHYELWLLRDDGTRLCPINATGGFSYTRAINSVGSFSVSLNPDFDLGYIAYDRRVNIWRQPVGGAGRIDFAGLVYDVDGWDDDSGEHNSIGGDSLEAILASRVIAALSGTAEAEKRDSAGDVMKAFVRENLGSSAAAARQLSSALLSVAADSSDGVTLSKGASFNNLLDTIQDIANVSRQQGTEIYFAVVPTTETLFEFRTFTGQPGHDLTDSGLVFSTERGNIKNPSLKRTKRGAVNVGYALGQGVGPLRANKSAEDTSRSGLSLFARAEGKIETNEASDSALQDRAYQVVTEGRPRAEFRCDIPSVPGCAYGLDWDLGDRILVNFRSLIFDALIRSVTVTVDGNKRETISGMVEAYL